MANNLGFGQKLKFQSDRNFAKNIEISVKNLNFIRNRKFGQASKSYLCKFLSKSVQKWSKTEILVKNRIFRP